MKGNDLSFRPPPPSLFLTEYNNLISSSQNITTLFLQNRAYLTYDSVWVVANALRTVMHEDHLEINPPILDFWSTPVRHYNEGKMLLHYMLEVRDIVVYSGSTVC